MSLFRTAAVLATACTALLGTAGTATAAVTATTATATTATTTTRALIDGHVSVSAVQGALPVGATVSVVQQCAAGTRLDRSATREVAREPSGGLDRLLRGVSRELGTVGM